MPQLLPPENIENTLEAYLPQISTKSQIIYSTVLLAIFGVLFSLPFLYVNVSVQSAGVLRTVAEKTEVKSLVAGTVARVWVKENQAIKQNEPLFTLKTDVLDSKIQLNELQQNDRKNYIHDLNLLVSIDSAQIFQRKGLISPLYSQQYNQFKYSLFENLQRQRKVGKELKADNFLHQEKVLSTREFDDKAFEFNSLQTAFKLLLERQISTWQNELKDNQATLSQLEAEKNQLTEEK